jgi:poly(ADP-ribose) glycohydrolase ARH3
MSITLEDRFAGCLLGAAIGDALGMGYVGRSAAEIRAAGGGSQYVPAAGFSMAISLPVGESGATEIGQPLEAGQFTEDTQLTIALARALVEEGGLFVGESWAHALVRWVNGEPRSSGTSTIQAALQLRTGGVEWDEAADPEGAGSGPAARVAPVGLVYFRDADTRRRVAVTQALVTHGHPDAQAAALAMAEAVAILVASPHPTGSNFQGARFLRSIEEVVRHASPNFEEMARCITMAADLLTDGVERADALRVIGCSGWCREAVPAALYAFASLPDNPAEAIADAIRLTGGATDTIGSMAGALVGAAHGASALPARWKAELEESEQIADLGIALTGLSSRIG